MSTLPTAVCYVVGIISNEFLSSGTRASLYEQYLDVSDGGSSFQWLLNNVAVNKLKEASIAVVLQMRKVLECCEPQDVPLNL